MKRKIGFSLIELLLVMVILAIIVIIAYPKILNSYKKAKKDTFLTESKTVFVEANKKFTNSKFQNTKIDLITDSNENSLKLSNKKLKYCVHLDKNGITNIKVTNGEYYIEGTSAFLEESKIDIAKYGNFSKFDCDYTLDNKDLIEEVSIATIKNTKKYAIITKCLWVGFILLLIATIIVKGKNRNMR